MSKLRDISERIDVLSDELASVACDFRIPVNDAWRITATATKLASLATDVRTIAMMLKYQNVDHYDAV